MNEFEAPSQEQMVKILSEIVSAYVSNNSCAISELPALIQKVHGALAGLTTGSQENTPEAVEKPTAAQIRKSITQDALISFEDGRSYRTLRRHLAMRGLSAADYRLKYGLPSDYPMTAPGYFAMRSALARSQGLGQMRRTARTRTSFNEMSNDTPNARRSLPKNAPEK